MAKSNPSVPGPKTLHWRLHTVMSERGIRTATELYRRLEPYALGITIHQLTRIVAGLPARLNTQVLSALLDVLQCDADDLLRLGGAAPAPVRLRAVKDRAEPAAALKSQTTDSGAPTLTEKPSSRAGGPPLSVLGPGVSSLVTRVVPTQPR